MAYCDHDPALLTVFAKGFDRHVERVGGYGLDGEAFAEDLAAAGWRATWAFIDDDDEREVSIAVEDAWAECAEPYGDEDGDGEQRVSAAPHEVLDKLARDGITFARAI